MGFSAHNDRMPQDVEQAFLTEMMMSGAEKTDAQIWQGIAATNGQFGGFIELFTAEATVVKANNGIVPTGVAITSANVISEFDKVKQAIPVSLRRKNLAWIVSPDVADAYDSALISAGVTNGLGGNANTSQVYGRYTVETVNGLPDNTIVVYEIKNLFFGTGLLSDHNEVRIKDMDESDLSGTVSYKEVFTAGVQVANPEDVVLYLSTTTPA